MITFKFFGFKILIAGLGVGDSITQWHVHLTSQIASQSPYSSSERDCLIIPSYFSFQKHELIVFTYLLFTHLSTSLFSSYDTDQPKVSCGPSGEFDGTRPFGWCLK